VSIYSRNSENHTPKYPEIVEYMKSVLKPGTRSVVLDCEVVAYDRANEKLLPFQAIPPELWHLILRATWLATVITRLWIMRLWTLMRAPPPREQMPCGCPGWDMGDCNGHVGSRAKKSLQAFSRDAGPSKNKGFCDIHLGCRPSKALEWPVSSARMKVSKGHLAVRRHGTNRIHSVLFGMQNRTPCRAASRHQCQEHREQ
jgi:ATP dependent DNA ligase domain